MEHETFNTPRELAVLVAGALEAAQALDKRDEPARDAWAVVLDYQERLAEMTDPTTPEGSVTRCGAVYAAFRARQVDHGLALAERYLSEPGIEFQARWAIEMVLLFDRPAPEPSTTA
jgi:hypothetical protein